MPEIGCTYRDDPFRQLHATGCKCGGSVRLGGKLDRMCGPYARQLHRNPCQRPRTRSPARGGNESSDAATSSRSCLRDPNLSCRKRRQEDHQWRPRCPSAASLLSVLVASEQLGRRSDHHVHIRRSTARRGVVALTQCLNSGLLMPRLALRCTTQQRMSGDIIRQARGSKRSDVRQ